MTHRLFAAALVLACLPAIAVPVIAAEGGFTHRPRPEQVIAYDYSLKLGKRTQKGIIGVPADGLGGDDEWSIWAREPLDLALKAAMFLPGDRAGAAGGQWQRDRAPWRLKEGGDYRGELLAPAPGDAEGVRRIAATWSFTRPGKYDRLLVGAWPSSGVLRVQAVFDTGLGVIREASVEGEITYPEAQAGRRPPAKPESLKASFTFREILDPSSAELRAAIDQAVERAVEMLKKQKPDEGYGGGLRALVVLALLHAGVPAVDAKVGRWLAELQRKAPTGTYGNALALMVLDVLTEPESERLARRRGQLVQPSQRQLSAAHTQWGNASVRELLSHLGADGSFHYTPAQAQGEGGKGDYSNTQYGVLGLIAARRLGLAVDPAHWEKIATAYLGMSGVPAGAFPPGGPGGEPGKPGDPDDPRRPGEPEPGKPADPTAGEPGDGLPAPPPLPTGAPAADPANAPARGWAYLVGSSDKPYGSMTAASLAVCHALRTILPDGFAHRPALETAIAGGRRWLAENWEVRGVPPLHEQHAVTDRTATDGWGVFYYLYAVERAGMLGGIERFGEHSWFEEGCWYLIGSQNEDGSWGQGVIDTSFALLFLVRATPPAPVTRSE